MASSPVQLSFSNRPQRALPSRPPPSSLRHPPHLGLLHPPSSSFNPAPTPPPSSPLPALPSFPSPIADTASLFTSTSYSTIETRGYGFGIHDETITDALLQDPKPRPSLEAHSRRLHPASKPDNSENAAKNRHPLAHHSPPSTLSPRSSIASDILSLSQTSRSLHSLSKRFSDAYEDPFEFDRLLEDSRSHKSSAHSTAVKATSSKPSVLLQPHFPALPDVSPTPTHPALSRSDLERFSKPEAPPERDSIKAIDRSRASAPSRSSVLTERQSTVSSESTSTARGRPDHRARLTDTTPGPSPTDSTFQKSRHSKPRSPGALGSPTRLHTRANPRAEDCPSPDIDTLIATHKAAQPRSRPSSSVRRIPSDLPNNPSHRGSSSSNTLSKRTDSMGSTMEQSIGDALSDVGLDEDDDDNFRPSSYYYSADYYPPSTSDIDVDAWRKGSLHSHIKDVVVEEDELGFSSDSSLDLHTPLPDLMLRAGILSPRSALIAKPDPLVDGQPTPSSKATAAELAKGVRGKVISKNRLVRHRDGKMLGRGLGLTTGLGWSDSEDEDAPSPLRHQISQIILGKKASNASLSSFTSTSNSSRITSHRESLFSTTTFSSSGSRRSSGAVTSGVPHPSKSSTNRNANSLPLHKSQSLAQLATSSGKSSSLGRQVSLGTSAHGVFNQQAPPSSFSASKLTSLSRHSSKGSVVSSQSSNSSLRLPRRQSKPDPARSRSPSDATSSADVSPLTPASSFASTSDPAIVSYPSGVGLGLGIVNEDTLSETSSKTSIFRMPISTGTAKPVPKSRTTSNNQLISPPVLRPRAPSTSESSFLSTDSNKLPAGNQQSISVSYARQRTISSSSATPPSTLSTGLPGPRVRTISTGSTKSAAAVSAYAGLSLKTKSSNASLRVHPSSDTPPAVPPKPPAMTKNQLSLQLPSMTLGTLAFPSPPPLSPALVNNMRIVQAQSAGSRKGSLASLGSSQSSHHFSRKN